MWILNASILVYKSRPERTGFNMYAEYTQLQLTFLALQPWLNVSKEIITGNLSVNLHYFVVIFT